VVGSRTPDVLDFSGHAVAEVGVGSRPVYLADDGRCDLPTVLAHPVGMI
jgi:hypothetical protein